VVAVLPRAPNTSTTSQGKNHIIQHSKTTPSKVSQHTHKNQKTYHLRPSNSIDYCFSLNISNFEASTNIPCTYKVFNIKGGYVVSLYINLNVKIPEFFRILAGLHLSTPHLVDELSKYLYPCLRILLSFIKPSTKCHVPPSSTYITKWNPLMITNFIQIWEYFLGVTNEQTSVFQLGNKQVSWTNQMTTAGNFQTTTDDTQFNEKKCLFQLNKTDRFQ
jgi:hypothetical protein